jgi:hypothetical protein
VADDLAAALVRELAAALPEPLNAELVDAIARVVVQLGRSSASTSAPELLTVAEVAGRLRVSAKWVYAHQHELGPIRLGDGPRARLRFDADVVDSRITNHRRVDDDVPQDSFEAPAAPPRRARRRLASRPLPPNRAAESRR